MTAVPQPSNLGDALDLLGLIEGVAWKCIRTGYYFELVSSHPSSDPFWVVVQNSLGESVCLLWCHLFGKRNDDLHYSKLFVRPEISSIAPQFQLSAVKSRLLARAGLVEPAFDALWNEVNRCRDKYIAHRDLDESVVFPQTDTCLRLVAELRDVLADCVVALSLQKPQDARLEGLAQFYRDQTRKALRDSAERSFLTGLRQGGKWAAELTAARVGQTVVDNPSKIATR